MKYKKATAVLLFIISRKKRNRPLTSNEKLLKMVAMTGLTLHIKQINKDIQKKYVFTQCPPPGFAQQSVESTFFDNKLFNAFFRFGMEEFPPCMNAMYLVENLSFVEEKTLVNTCQLIFAWWKWWGNLHFQAGSWSGLDLWYSSKQNLQHFLFN